MGSIFGSDGSIYTNNGSSTVNTKKNGTTITNHIGDSLFTSDGRRTYGQHSPTTYTNGRSGSNSIMRQGNMWYKGRRSYYTSGNTLFSSDGRSWNSPGGPISDDDIRNIILNDD